MIAGIGNVRITFGVERDVVGTIELCLGCRAAVARKAWFTGPREARDDVVTVDLADSPGDPIARVHGTFGVDGDPGRASQLGRQSNAAIAGAQARPLPGDCGNRALRIDLANASIFQIRDI